MGPNFLFLAAAGVFLQGDLIVSHYLTQFQILAKWGFLYVSMRKTFYQS